MPFPAFVTRQDIRGEDLSRKPLVLQWSYLPPMVRAMTAFAVWSLFSASS